MALGAVSIADAAGNISLSRLRHPSILSATYSPPPCVSFAGWHTVSPGAYLVTPS